MSDKKRDNKGRILRQGERQREDGRYEYRYKDIKGNIRSIYSWKLVVNKIAVNANITLLHQNLSRV